MLQADDPIWRKLCGIFVHRHQQARHGTLDKICLRQQEYRSGSENIHPVSSVLSHTLSRADASHSDMIYTIIVFLSGHFNFLSITIRNWGTFCVFHRSRYRFCHDSIFNKRYCVSPRVCLAKQYREVRHPCASLPRHADSSPSIPGDIKVYVYSNGEDCRNHHRLARVSVLAKLDKQDICEFYCHAYLHHSRLIQIPRLSQPGTGQSTQWTSRWKR